MVKYNMNDFHLNISFGVFGRFYRDIKKVYFSLIIEFYSAELFGGLFSAYSEKVLVLSVESVREGGSNTKIFPP